MPRDSNPPSACPLTPIGCIWNMHLLEGGLRSVNSRLWFASRVTLGSTRLTWL